MQGYTTTIRLYILPFIPSFLKVGGERQRTPPKLKLTILSLAKPMQLMKKRVRSLCRFLIFRHLIPSLPLKQTPCFLFVLTSPLLKEEGNLSFLALLLNIENPFFVHRTSLKP